MNSLSRSPFSISKFCFNLYMKQSKTTISSIRFRSSITNNISGDKWDLYASICLQRIPTIGPEMNWLERRLKDYLTKVEISDSLYSDHEMRHFEDLRRAERIASGVNVDEKDLEESAKQTAQDFEEASLLESKQFKKGSRVTEADLTNNRHSIDRSLDRHLYLVVRKSLGPNQHWLFPTELYNPHLDKSLRSTAERSLEQLYPDNLDSLNVKFLGNVPATYYWYRYPKSLSDEKNGMVGARIFLFKANLDSICAKTNPLIKGKFGERQLQPKIDKSVSDYGWLTRTELSKELPTKYWGTISKVIYTDELVNLDSLMQQSDKKFSRMSNRLRKIENKIANA
ncbi:39S ribosomal protein L46, mitochondrial [Blomia tropicalis]|nr:39S ribosomal protein L46, mitochondrial [Blomia tropicalis]